MLELSNVPQSHRVRPDEPVALADVGAANVPAADRAPRAAVIVPTHAIESTNVAAFAVKAHPAPTAATSTPPSIGPASRVASGRMNWSSELAWVRVPSGTRSGMVASNAGPKNAEPAP